MSYDEAYWRRMKEWIGEHRRDPEVREWLADHPPPPEWRGDRMEWAFLEMPDPDTFFGRLLLRLGA